MKLNKDTCRVLMGGDNRRSRYSCCTFDLNFFDTKGRGLVQLWEPLETSDPLDAGELIVSKKMPIFETCLAVQSSNDFTKSLDDPVCLNEELVGGKVSSLAKLIAVRSSQVR